MNNSWKLQNDSYLHETLVMMKMFDEILSPSTNNDDEPNFESVFIILHAILHKGNA